MLRFLLIGLVLVFVLMTPASACMWDRDTLAAEARGVPGLIEVIVGRIERNPPLFYEMRLDRVAKEIERDGTQLALYDDAAVACDRLGRHDEAIRWMERKAAAIEQATLDEAERNDHRYRYLANLGTFHAHRWLHGGSNRDDTADLHRSRDLIAQAIELNPDAHFGREKYQLMAIEWLIDPPVKDEFILPIGWKYEGAGLSSVGPSVEEVEGIVGLMALGAAWQSIDVLESLASLRSADASVSALIDNRIAELEAAGAKRGFPQLERMMWPRHGLADGRRQVLHAYFLEARAAAEQWHLRRMLYMMPRLRDGSHPDVDPAFWADFEDGPAHPAPPGMFTTGLGMIRAGDPTAIIVLVLVLGLAAMVVQHVIRRRRKARAALI